MALVVALLLAYFVLDSPWDVVVVVGAAVFELAEAGFWFWLSRRRAPQAGAETLIGARAVVATPCRPRGHVRVQGELWEARCDEGADAGDVVEVTGRDGLLLLVAALRRQTAAGATAPERP